MIKHVTLILPLAFVAQAQVITRQAAPAASPGAAHANKRPQLRREGPAARAGARVAAERPLGNEVATSRRSFLSASLAASLGGGTLFGVALPPPRPAMAGVFTPPAPILEAKRKSQMKFWLGAVRNARDRLAEADRLARLGSYDMSITALEGAAESCLVPREGSIAEQQRQFVDTCTFRILMKNVGKRAEEYVKGGSGPQLIAVTEARSAGDELIARLEELRDALEMARTSNVDREALLAKFAKSKQDIDRFELSLQTVLGEERPTLDLPISVVAQTSVEFISTPAVVLIGFLAGSALTSAAALACRGRRRGSAPAHEGEEPFLLVA